MGEENLKLVALGSVPCKPIAPITLSKAYEKDNVQ